MLATQNYPYHIFLFDMDGVLLQPRGYHTALQASVKRIGQALGVPQADLTENQIAHFEALNITNEWDSVAICAALTLIHVWQFDPHLRLDGIMPCSCLISDQKPNFDSFLKLLPDGGDLPGETAYTFLLDHHPWLNEEQRAHLWKILSQCRDIYQSLTLALHQENVLGSKAFHDHYRLQPRFDTHSYLLKYDRPLMSDQQYILLREWLKLPNHKAGILTNRPSRSPDGYLSSPEAELGMALIGLEDLPYIGSGMLAWFAVNNCQLPDHALLKPNPIHALTLLQRCLGQTLTTSLERAVSLWQGEYDRQDWQMLDNAKIVVFEDSVKGLQSALAACILLKELSVIVSCKLVGVGKNPIKLAALDTISHYNIECINQVNWIDIFS
jgi:phosphoglycolate phosphatase-like HAD superfamily hydrolase